MRIPADLGYGERAVGGAARDGKADRGVLGFVLVWLQENRKEQASNGTGEGHGGGKSDAGATFCTRGIPRTKWHQRKVFGPYVLVKRSIGLLGVGRDGHGL